MLDAIAKPFGWLLLWLYETIHDYGLAIIAFGLIVKLILWPFMGKSKLSSLRSSRLQPKIKEIEKRHGANKQKYNEELQKLYHDEGVNPMSGCLWALLPFPILLALYQAIRKPITVMMGVTEELLQDGGALLTKLNDLGLQKWLTDLGITRQAQSYPEIFQAKFITSNWAAHSDEFLKIHEKIKDLDFRMFGFVDLAEQPQWKFLWTTDWSDVSVWGPGLVMFLIPILAAFLTYLTSKISQSMTPQPEGANQMQTMMIVMPLITLWFAYMMPAALGLYWIVSSGFGIIQDIIMTKHAMKKLDAEDAERIQRDAEKNAALEAKRLETERLKAENATVENKSTSKKKQQIKAREEQAAKNAEWEKSHAPAKEEAYEPSREGSRRYARGRAYDPDRFTRSEADPAPAEEEAPGENGYAVELIADSSEEETEE